MQFQFPPFEGKVARFNKLNVKHVVRLPYKPDRSDVYILSCSESEFIKTDGWRWSSANKSNKLNFANIPGIQKAVKFRCAVTDCTAVKFVDIVYKYCLARVYYDGEHKHNKSKSNLSEVLRSNEAFDKKEGESINILTTTQNRMMISRSQLLSRNVLKSLISLLIRCLNPKYQGSVLK